MSRLHDKVAIVTGSSQGIGEGIARRLAAEGARVVVNSSSSIDEGARVAASLPDAIYVRADLGDEGEACSLVGAAVQRWGRLDIVVNNAAIAPRVIHSHLDELTDDIWRRVFDVNLMGPWHLIRAAVPHLRASGEGAIVNVTSLAAVKITENLSCIPYHLSKSALTHLTMLLANALGPEIRVNALAPGAIETPMWGEHRDFLRARVAERSALGRAGTPEDLAEACLFLTLPGYVTGQVLVVDGGRGIAIDRYDEMIGQATQAGEHASAYTSEQNK